MDGTVGHQNSQESLLSYIGKAITPALEPIGVEEDNWPATVGVFTGIFAKEAVVGTLDALYQEVSAEKIEGTTEFDFWTGIGDAFISI